MKKQCLGLGFGPEHPSLQRDVHGRSTSDVIHELSIMSQADLTDPLIRLRAIAVLQSCATMDDAYNKWARSTLTAWQRREIDVANAPRWVDNEVFPHTGVAYLYSCPVKACHATMYQTQYIVLHQSILVLARQLGITDWSIPSSGQIPGRELNMQQSQAFIQELSDDVLSATPFALGQIHHDGYPSETVPGRAVGAYYLLASLGNMQFNMDATQDQRNDAVRALGFIGNSLGVRRAIKGFIPVRGNPNVSQSMETDRVTRSIPQSADDEITSPSSWRDTQTPTTEDSLPSQHVSPAGWSDSYNPSQYLTASNSISPSTRGSALSIQSIPKSQLPNKMMSTVIRMSPPTSASTVPAVPS